MPAADERKLLQPLTPALRAKVIAALAHPLAADGTESPKANKALIEVFHALEMPPANGPVVLPASLTPAQRGLAELFARREGYGCYGAPFPRSAAVRRRWLGLEPPGILEREVAFKHEGEAPRVALWRALALLADESSTDAARFLIALRLPLPDRLALLSEVARDAYHLSELLPYFPWAALAELKAAAPAVTAWAVREADAFARGPRPSPIVLWPIFAALMAAKIPIAPAWDALVPSGMKPAEIALLKRIAKALPEPRRGAALARAIQPLWNSKAVEVGLALLADFPSRALAQAVFERADDAGRMSRRDVIKALETLGRTHAVIADVVAPAVKKQKPPLVLRALAAIKPRAITALNPLQQKQLAAAGKRYDGKALPAATRLSRDKAHEEVSFAGFFEIVDIADASGQVLYIALRYAVDSGCIFAAGTTRVVAEIIQFGLQCKDDQLREALDLALRKKAKPQRSGMRRGISKRSITPR